MSSASADSPSADRLERARLPRTAAGPESIPYYLVTIGNGISWGSAQEYLHRFGIGVNEWRLMAHIAYDPGCTAAEVSRFLRIDKAVISRSLKRLISRGLVGVDVEIGTRHLYLTHAGVALHDTVLPVALRREEILLGDLDADEREVLLALLRRMHTNLAAMNDFDRSVKP